MNEQQSNPLGGLPFIKNASSKRESSYDRTGGNRDFAVVEPGATHVMDDIKGAGCIKHIWMTTRCYAPQYLRKLVLQMYWDGEENPSVRVPFGDFFGIGHATCKHYVALPLSMVMGEKRGPKGSFAASMNCYFPMPFVDGPKIQLINESEEKVENLFYYVDYEAYDSKDQIPDDMGRFHATWNRENPAPWDLPGKNTTGDENYVILDAEGKGHYVGCVLNIDNFDVSNQEYTWPGEGDDMFFIDGEEWPPSLHGTGTEDYFNAAWGFPCGEYAGSYKEYLWEAMSKSTLANGAFTVSILKIQSVLINRFGLRSSGHANDHGNDYSSVAYWYQLEPHKPLPELPPVKDRLPRRWPEHGLWDRKFI